jgi:hypothetical protein
MDRRKTYGRNKKMIDSFNFDLFNDNGKCDYCTFPKKKNRYFAVQQNENDSNSNNKIYEEPDDIESRLLENE